MAVRHRALLTVVTVAGCAAVGCFDQRRHEEYRPPTLERGSVQLVGAPDQRLARKVSDLVHASRVLPGVGSQVLWSDTIRVDFVDDMDWRDGVAYPGTLAFSIPTSSITWPGDRLTRVVRHEMGHLALGKVLPPSTLPAWVREGFPEWVSGDLSCQAVARIHVDVAIGPRLGRPPPSLFDPHPAVPQPIQYDYFALAFDFLDRRSEGRVSDGALLLAMRERGIRRGIQEIAGIELDQLEALWLEDIKWRFGSDSVLCSGS